MVVDRVIPANGEAGDGMEETDRQKGYGDQQRHGRCRLGFRFCFAHGKLRRGMLEGVDRVTGSIKNPGSCRDIAEACFAKVI
jgi:hypothetical protein